MKSSRTQGPKSIEAPRAKSAASAENRTHKPMADGGTSSDKDAQGDQEAAADAAHRRAMSAPSPRRKTDVAPPAPQRSRAQSDLFPVTSHAGPMTSLRQWRAAFAPDIARAKAALNGREQFPTLADGETFVDESDDNRKYSEPQGSVRKIVGVHAIDMPRGLEALHPHKIASILAGLAQNRSFLPIKIDERGEILNGNHRLFVAKLVGVSEMVVLVSSAPSFKA